MKTISFYNIKGGVAKTTSTLAFAQILHNDYGKRVLVFDIDKQANSTKTLGCYDADGLSSADLLVSKKNIVRDVIKHSEYGIDVIPANYNLIKANKDVLYDALRPQQTRFKAQLEEVQNDYDYCIIDHSIEDNMAVVNGLVITDDVLVPIKFDRYGLDGIYQLLVRVLKEQTVVEESGARRLKTKEDGAMGSQILQNPSDPDATYREKAGKQNRGYTANVVETVGDNGSIVTDYQYEKNTHSDSQFLKETVNAMEKTEKPTEKPTVLITDGAYSGRDNTDAAAEKNIDLVTTDLFPKSADRAEIVVHFLTQNRVNSGYLLFYMKFSRNIDSYGR